MKFESWSSAHGTLKKVSKIIKYINTLTVKEVWGGDQSSGSIWYQFLLPPKLLHRKHCPQKSLISGLQKVCEVGKAGIQFPSYRRRHWGSERWGDRLVVETGHDWASPHVSAEAPSWKPGWHSPAEPGEGWAERERLGKNSGDKATTSSTSF